jgi:hypothetical protein
MAFRIGGLARNGQVPSLRGNLAEHCGECGGERHHDWFCSLEVVLKEPALHAHDQRPRSY